MQMAAPPSKASILREKRRHRAREMAIAPLTVRHTYEYIFPDFRRDPSRYASAEQYWEVVFNRARETAPVPPEEAWTLHWSCNPLRDGGSIFTAICRARQIAIRISQMAPGPEAIPFSWQIAKLEPRRRDPEMSEAKLAKRIISELNIICVPSVYVMKRVQPLLTCWLRGAIVPQEFMPRYDHDQN